VLRECKREVAQHDHEQAMVLAKRAQQALSQLNTVFKFPELLTYDLRFIADRVRRVEIERTSSLIEAWASLTTSTLRKEGRVLSPSPWPVAPPLTRQTVLPVARYLARALEACGHQPDPERCCMLLPAVERLSELARLSYAAHENAWLRETCKMFA
jgi:hypothetical protein